MTVNINGTSGISGVDGSAGTPALQGSDSNTGISFGTDEVNINTGGSTRATVDSSGNVGINTTSPAGANGKALTVYASDYPRLRLINDATGTGSGDGSGMFLNSDDLYISNEESAGVMLFRTAAAERMRISDGGSIAFGTTETSLISGTGFKFNPGTTLPNIGLVVDSSTGGSSHIHLYNANATNNGFRFYVKSDGGINNFSANNSNLSDRNVKKDIAPAAGTWDCLKEWEIVNFRYKDQADDADLNMGVIAQQVAESCPEVVTVFQEAKEATETEPAQEERLGVKDQQMMWMAIKALQESMERIETLETANASQATIIAALDARLTALEGGTNP
jgi:hypothetical protein